MLHERNQVVIGLVVILTILGGTVFAVGASSGLLKKGTPLHAEFTDAAGLESGNFVYVAGIRSGSVTGVHIDGDHVQVDFTLRPAGIPKDSTASIILENTLGKRAIRINPGGSETAFAADDTIPIDRTDTPVDFPQLGNATTDVLKGSDVKSLNTVTAALADITKGMRTDVGNLIDGLNTVTKTVADRRDDLKTIINQTNTLVDAAADKDHELVTIVDQFGSTLDQLAKRREDISKLLTQTAGATNTAADLVSDRHKQLDGILNELHNDLQIADNHQVDLASLFAYAGVSVNGFASIQYQGGAAKKDNPSWGNVFVDNLGQAGVGALLGCGGAVDSLLTQLIGPDPNCPQGPKGPSNPSGAAGGSSTNGSVNPAPVPAAMKPYRSVDALFTPAPSGEEVAR